MSNGSTPLRSIRIDDDFWAEVKTAMDVPAFLVKRRGAGPWERVE